MAALPPPVLATPRLKLRGFEERDAAGKFAIFSDPKVARFWGDELWTGLAQAEEAIAQARAGYRDGSSLRLGVELVQSGALVGYVNLYGFELEHRRCEIGYALASSQWGKGYACEALQALLDYGFRELGLNRVEADIDPRNDGSIRLLERLGFRREGFMPERWMVHDETADTLFYGLLKRYWDARQDRSSGKATS